jgi:eukaryotic-like serine/threonine-protein kinase
MAEVFIGEPVESYIDRRVAIKALLLPYCQHPEMVERFVNEARALGRINHPGVVEIYDVERLPSGRVCLVMELLRGQPLHVVLAQRGRLTIPEAVAIAVQISDAMAAAHAQRIVHRDLKPENVFLHQDHDGLRVKVLDFGIAKLQDGAGAVQTGTRSQLGTATYMSPEQFRSSRDVDHRTDVYSLGCMLYQMLTGSPPYVHSNIVEQMRAHAFEPVPALRVQVPDAPPALEAVVTRMLAKDRGERYGSMQEVHAALEAAMGVAPAPTGNPFADEPATIIDPRLPAPVARRGLAIAIAMIAVVIAVCIAIALLI